MDNYCGAKCENCSVKKHCKGCKATLGSPFGGKCVAASYIKLGGMDAYNQYKSKTLDEVNELLSQNGIGKANELNELLGSYVNLAYPLPSGKSIQFLNENDIYLGCQIEFADLGICYGVVADTSFILICSYSINGSLPELICYKRR